MFYKSVLEKTRWKFPFEIAELVSVLGEKQHFSSAQPGEMVSWKKMWAWGLAQATQGANGQAYWSPGCSPVPQGLTSLPPLISVPFDLQECTARPLTNKQWPRD